MTEKPTTPRKGNRKGGKGKGRSRPPRTIGTNVGQVIREAQAAEEAERNARAAAIARKIASASK